MFSNFSVRKPYTVVVAVILIGILGAVSLINMSTDLLPSINLPYAIVSTSYEGASPEEVESILSKSIEQQMASISNIQNVRSVSREESSIVILEFTENTNMDSALIEMRESLDMIMAYMPEEVGSPIILKLNPDMMPISVISASIEDEKIAESSKLIENKIIPELEGVEGVAYVQANGLLENRIEAIIKDDKIEEVNKELAEKTAEYMAEQALNSSTAQTLPSANTENSSDGLSITKEMVSGILQGQNFSMPSGYITEDDITYLVRTGDELGSLEDLKKLPVIVPSIPDMAPILLEDIAEINKVTNSGEVYNKVNGNEAVVVTIQKQTEFSTSEVAKNLRDKMDEVMDENEGLELVSLMDQGEYIDLVVSSIGQNLIIGAVLAVLILLIFLRALKPTIVVGFAIPVSLVTAFVMMYFSDVSLNIISMGGLALGVGMLVDNSIVVIENIYRMRNEGKSAKEAAIQGAKQVTGAITASTLTTISVFLPILFTEGLTREIFTDMGLTIAYSLIASLIIAVTLVPMLSSQMLKKNIKKEHKFFNKIQNSYSKMLNFTLNHKSIIILLVIVLFAGSIYGALQEGTEFLPSSDTGEINITAEMPTDNTFKETTKTSDEILDILGDIDEIETLGASLSNGGLFSMGMAEGSSNSLSIYVTLKEDREKTTSEISQLIRNNTKDLDTELTISDSNMDLTSMSGGVISITVKGKEFDTLEKLANEVGDVVTEIEGTTEVENGIEKTEPEISVVVDKEKSIEKGLTIAQVYQALSGILKESQPDSQLSLNAKDYDIYIKDEDSNNSITKDDLKKFAIENTQGEKIKLSDISEITEQDGFGSISRSGQQRILTITGNLEDGYNIGQVSTEIRDELDKLEVPDGYSVEVGGEYETIVESFKDLFMMLALAIVFIYLIMVAQFQSLLSPFIVMFTIPLAFTGGFLGLIVTRNPVSVIAMLGLIILSGVVVNNGIVFVDYINIMRREGLNKRDAILKTGKDRLRPIIMTALTTIFALSSLSLGMGQGSEMMQPMAITAIGGLIYATVITLFLIPVLYEILNRKEYKSDVVENG
jgi:HAE1 family hydrophobic/amphiphilic exporter-1